MAAEFINPDSLMSTERYGYAHAVRVGNQIWVAGQNAWHRDRRVVGAGDFAAQAESVFESLATILRAAGADFTNVVKMTNYLTRPDDLRAFILTRRRFFAGHTPASTTVVVTALAHPDLLLEVDLIAVRR